MSKIKYRYNPHTLKFDVISHPLRKKIAKIAIHFLVSVTLAATLSFVYSIFLDTPKEKNIKRDIADILLKYELFQKKIVENGAIMNHYQKRDNNIYRAIFEADSIPASLRIGGYGGANRYKAFEKNQNAEILTKTFTMFDQLSWEVYVQSKSFDEVETWAINKDKMNHCVPRIQPVSSNNTSAHFGFRLDPFTHRPTMHYGIDFTGSIGTPIYVTGDGVVLEAEYTFNGYGNEILVDHGFGYKTRYAHLSKIKVARGETVKRGQVIGLLGNTGKSTGPHLHYEVIHKNTHTDPLNYFNDQTSEDFDNMIKNASLENNESYSISE